MATIPPLNLALRFVLEMSALVIFGIRGYRLSETGTRYLLMPLLPLAFAALWGVFAVPGDPSRSGKTVVRTPGPLRLLLELALFALAALMLFSLGHRTLSLILIALTLLHYITTPARLRWLLKTNK